jgi:putative FmdB family regulatory protein
MPIYEYKCQKCGDVFDVRQKFSDEPVKQHEGCGGEVEKLISTSAFQFKGSGWYVTDYASKKTSNGAKNGEKKDDSTKSETKSETKSAEPATTTPTPAKTDSK